MLKAASNPEVRQVSMPLDRRGASTLGGSNVKIALVDAFANIEKEMLTALAALKTETNLVYQDLVLPNWGSPNLHGFPSILYGSIMSAMSLSLIGCLAIYRVRETAIKQSAFVNCLKLKVMTRNQRE